MRLRSPVQSRVACWFAVTVAEEAFTPCTLVDGSSMENCEISTWTSSLFDGSLHLAHAYSANARSSGMASVARSCRKERMSARDHGACLAVAWAEAV